MQKQRSLPIVCCFYSLGGLFWHFAKLFIITWMHFIAAITQRCSDENKPLRINTKTTKKERKRKKNLPVPLLFPRGRHGEPRVWYDDIYTALVEYERHHLTRAAQGHFGPRGLLVIAKGLGADVNPTLPVIDLLWIYYSVSRTPLYICTWCCVTKCERVLFLHVHLLFYLTHKEVVQIRLNRLA